MINDFTKAISRKINTLYPTYNFYVDEQRQNFDEPCFYAKVISAKIDKKLDRRRIEEIQYDLMCFLEKETEQIEFILQDIADNLFIELELIDIDSKKFRTFEKNSEIVDSVLHFTFKIKPAVYVEKEVVDLINDIEVDITPKGGI